MILMADDRFAQVRYVVFDLDNTLYDHAEFVKSSYATIALRLAQLSGVSADTVNEYMFGLWSAYTSAWPHVFSHTITRFGLVGRVTERDMVAWYHANEPKTLTSFPGASDTLEALGQRYRLALLTDGRPVTQRRKLSLLGMAGFFETIMVTGDLGREFYKPSPEPFKRLTEEMDSPNKGALVYVGDNPALDVTGARMAGYGTIRLRLGEFAQVEPASEEQRADADAHSFEELARLLSV